MNYSVINFPNDIIQDILRNKENTLTKGNINDASGLTKRNSSVSWINNPDICQRVFGVMKNKVADFSSLHIDNIEPLQYSEYDTSQEYGWHQDLNNKPYPDGRIRKVSFSIFLNDNFEGGEFDLEIHGPDATPRYISEGKRSNENCILFHSDMCNNVRPVKYGTRNSIVEW